MLNDLFEFMGAMLALTVCTAFAIFMLVAIWAWTGGPASCDAFEKHTKLETSYDFWGGCFVTMKDGRIFEKDIARAIWEKDYKISMDK